jgi:hypothetical protein
MEMMNKKIIAILGIVLLVVIGGIGYFILNNSNESNVEVTETTTEVVEEEVEEFEEVSSDINQLEGLEPGTAVADPRGFAIDENLVVFTNKLNEVNEYVFANLANFESGEEIDAIYNELWSYGESFGYRLSSVLNSQSIEAGDSEFTPQISYFLNIVTKDNVSYCAVDERVLDPNYRPEQALTQSIIASSCSEYLLNFKKIIDRESSNE